ncbi:MAG: prepilin-type N-terminal cleavage/methylation domain-containing protein [Sulfolobaceae archaeon]
MKSQKGFTIVELLIVLAVLTILIALSIGGITKLQNLYRRTETQNYLNAMASGLQACYSERAWVIDNASYLGQASLNVDTGANGTIDTINNDTPTIAGGQPNQAWLDIGKTFFTLPYENMIRDAWGNPYYIFVSQPLGNQDGIMYRVIAIVSLGSSHKLQSTFNTATGALTLGGTNIGVTISGASIETQKYQDTINLLNQYVKYLDQTFATLFQSDPTKNIAVDHFVSTDQTGTVTPYTDPNSGIKNSCYISPSNCLATVSQANIALSTSENDQMNAWYYPSASPTSLTQMSIYIDNWSSSVRQPNNSMPPYTAHIISYTPWGYQIIITAVGTTS